MDTSLGKRIATLRKEKGMTQDDIAQKLDVSSQAVSKWENDQTCPDISLLPRLANILGITVDELLSGKEEMKPIVTLGSKENSTDIKDMMLRIVVDSKEGDKVRINLPMALIQLTIEMGLEMPQISGNSALKDIDWKKIMDLVSLGVIGNLVEVESSDGDTVRIFVE